TAPLVFVRNADQDPAEICWQALKISYERLAGELGIDAWVAAGGPLRRIRLVTPDAIGDAPVLDVRQDAEYAAGHLPGADHLELGALRAHELADGPRVVMCGHGERAMSAASLLERAGHRQVAVLVGGADDWAKTTGRTLTQGA
ncbi:hydrolase, partial [Carbonactinospora thermoautotrophica]